MANHQRRLLFVIICCFYLTKSNSKQVYLVVGQSQKGKSSFIRDITGHQIEVGNFGEGSSCTSQIKDYKSKKHFNNSIFIDSVGLYGTDLNKVQQLQITLQWYLLNNSLPHISGIIMIDSYTGDTTSLNKGLQFISEVFGTIPPKSITIFLTKKNMIADEQYCLLRKLAIQKHIQKLNITIKVLDIQTTYSKKPILSNEQQQIFEIGQILKDLQPIELKSLQLKRKQLSDMAKQIQKKKSKLIPYNYTISYQTLKPGLWNFIFRNYQTKHYLVKKQALYEPQIQECQKQAAKIVKNQIKDKLLLKE